MMHWRRLLAPWLRLLAMATVLEPQVPPLRLNAMSDAEPQNHREVAARWDGLHPPPAASKLLQTSSKANPFTTETALAFRQLLFFMQAVC